MSLSSGSENYFSSMCLELGDISSLIILNSTTKSTLDLCLFRLGQKIIFLVVGILAIYRPSYDRSASSIGFHISIVAIIFVKLLQDPT